MSIELSRCTRCGSYVDPEYAEKHELFDDLIEAIAKTSAAFSHTVAITYEQFRAI